MSASADIANFQMGAPLLVWGGRSFKPGRSLNFSAVKRDAHSGRGALSDYYGTRNTLLPLVVLIFPLVVLFHLLVIFVYLLIVLVCPLVVLIGPFVCPFVVLVCPLAVSVCPLVVPVVLSVGLFITDRQKMKRVPWFIYISP